MERVGVDRDAAGLWSRGAGLVRRLLVVALLWCLLSDAAAAKDIPSVVRRISVGLHLHRRRIVVSSTRGCVYRVAGRTLRAAAGAKVVFEARGKDTMKAAGWNVRERIRIEPVRGGVLVWNGSRYRGVFLVGPDGRGGLDLVNELDIEDYLKGVLKAEMPPSFHIEALKAQAVLCRTYAMKHRRDYEKRGFGLKATEQSQVYLGMDGETPVTTRAVMATRGLVAVWHGELIQGYFHSCCGGVTASNEEVWPGKPLPYCRSVRCPFCRIYSRFEWKASIPVREIEKSLHEFGYEFDGMDKLLCQYTSSGRIRNFVVVDGHGRRVVIPGNRFRIIVDRRRIRSLRVSRMAVSKDLRAPMLALADLEGSAAVRAFLEDYIRTSGASVGDKVIELRGEGFGHGVGMCQWGAEGMARRGADFRRILKYYFRGVDVRKAY